MNKKQSAGALALSSIPVLFTFGAVFCAAVFLLLLQQISAVVAGNPVAFGFAWVPAIDVDMNFRLDGLSLLFALIVSGVGALIFLYSSVYFKEYKEGRRIFVILFLFMLAMLGLVTANNILTLFVFWELTTITSYLLIGTKHEEEKARKLALQALLVTGLGGLLFLAGLVLLGNMAQTYTVSEIISQDLTDHAAYPIVFWLILAGCITKSALFPFHFWLPNAMAAPTPISAYLHSATMVKAGLYILARFHPSLSGTDVWFYTLAGLGAITAVWSSILALRQTDLKLMLAYTTVMALGTIALFLAGSSALAVLTALSFLLIHALYKASLFLVVSNIEKSSGTRDWRQVSGLKGAVPLTALAALFAGLSMAGVPPFLGFIGKEFQLEAALAMPHYALLLTAAVLAAAVMMAGVAFFVIRKPFLGAPSAKAKSLSWVLSVPPFVLALAGLLMGIMPSLLPQPLLHAATTALQPEGEIASLKLWHGFGLVLLLSAIAISGGVLISWKFPFVYNAVNGFVKAIPVSCEKGYERILSGCLAFAKWQIGVLQNGRQRSYVMVVFVTLCFLLGITAIANPAILPQGLTLPTQVPLYQWLLCGCIVVGIIIAVFSDSRLLAICALGVIGTGIALVFVIYSAPDVAMTQFMTEILIVIILAIVILRLPSLPKEQRQSNASRLRDGVVAIASGGFVTMLMLAMSATPFDRQISTYYIENSYPEAFGRNIVNVILVDFRAIDTLGEILVVAIAGLTCFALVKLRARKGE